MNMKQLETILYSFNDYSNKMGIIEAQMKMINSNYDVLCAVDTSKEYSSPTNKINSSVENFVCKKDSKLEKLKSEKEYLTNQHNMIQLALDTLEPKKLQFIKFKYFEECTKTELARKLFIGETTVARRRIEILNSLLEILNIAS